MATAGVVLFDATAAGGVVPGATPGDNGWLAVLAALVTQLADAWFLICLLSLGYWLAPRLAGDPRAVAASLVGVALTALAVSLAAKAVVAVPRPPGAAVATAPGWLPDPFARAFRDAATDGGYGFPSGHALAATAVYGGLASFLDVATARRRRAVAATLVVAVGGSRVVLGLHTVGDVVGGAVLGLVTLWGCARLARPGLRPRPDRVSFLAAVVGVVAVAAGLARGSEPTAVGAAVAVGGGAGGYLVWRLRGRDRTPVGPGGAAVGLAVAGVPFVYAATVVERGVPVVLGLFADTVWLRVAATIPTAAAAVALVVAWPTVVGRLRASPTGER